jgi:hypothetical protein
MDALEQLKVNVVAVEASVAKNTGDICDLQKEVKGLKQQLNARDQENRANVLRLTGFPYVKEEKGNRSVLQKAVFDRILKPILDAAVSNGQIAPPTKQLEFDCFRVGRWPPPRVPGSAAAELYVNPPPIVIKFADLDLRTTVLRNKRLNMPKPSEEERRLGVKGFFLVEDLTAPTFKALRAMQNHQDVEKAWTVGGKIKFTTKEDKKTIQTVSSVFEDVDSMIFNAK